MSNDIPKKRNKDVDVSKLVRDILNDVQEMQDNGCSDGCHCIVFNLERMYKEYLKDE